MSANSRYLAPKVPGGLLMSSGTDFTPSEELILQQLADLAYVLGDILYFDGSQLQRLGIGSTGNVLKVVGGIPAWGAVPGASMLSPTETPNGSRTVFTFSTATAQPSYILTDGTQVPATSQSGVVYWTWSAGPKQATMVMPPTDNILAIP